MLSRFGPMPEKVIHGVILWKIPLYFLETFFSRSCCLFLIRTKVLPHSGFISMNSSYTSFHKRLWTLDEEALSFSNRGPHRNRRSFCFFLTNLLTLIVFAILPTGCVCCSAEYLLLTEHQMAHGKKWKMTMATKDYMAFSLPPCWTVHSYWVVHFYYKRKKHRQVITCFPENHISIIAS